MNKNQLEIIAKNVVRNVGERDINGNCLGKCNLISQLIYRELYRNLYSDMEIISPTLFINDGYTFYAHKALLLKDQNLIIDTQWWQYHKFISLEKRKVIFTPFEYKKLGFIEW